MQEIEILHPRMLETEEQGSLSRQDVFTALSTYKPRVIDLSKLSEADGLYLSAQGISEQLLIEAAEDSRVRETQLLASFNPNYCPVSRTATPFEKEIFEKALLRDASYVLTVFECGGMLVRDPWSGDVVRSSHSFLIDDYHTAFRFCSKEVFYLMVGQTFGRRIAFIVPRLRLVAIFPLNPINAALLAWITECADHLVATLISKGASIRRVLTCPTIGGGIQVGFRPNLGHYVWQELQGIADVIEAVGVKRIFHLVLGPYAPFDPRDVFPELSSVLTTVVKNPVEPFDATFHLNVQHVRPVGLRISSTLRRRIQELSESRLSKERKDAIQARASSKFLVWVNLRSHNKAWKRQVDGTAEVLNRLSERIPNLAVVFDGFSDTADICAAIGGLLDPEIDVVNTLGCPLEESLGWARAIHVYISVVGSGLVINSWLSKKPGVAHANRAHLRQATFWGLVAEDIVAPIFLSPTIVEDDGTMYGTYDFDPDVLYELVLSLVQSYYPHSLCEAGQPAANPSA
ncbi:hypothetical protein [Bradyrhizobium sp. BR 10261]|uniref:hypothetical protein n=1 Tax=Bradyrhizobium sp. BR 10261 TaxID=2749992 RepID=UPI001C64D867|nr:hypothetical protein [Bradyrhizobium sp. BR 10261]MBW7961803.1 hypothetical protein [Bradyrhizobium sp. BR 10261]